MNMYLDEKQRKKRRRILKLKIYGGAAAFFVLLIGAGYLIVYSPLFQIKDITQTNADLTQTDADKIIESLKIFFANQSKVSRFLGANNILIWKNQIDKNFFKDYPRFSNLIIKKDYLKRTVEIKAEEREKFGIWCASECWWFDKEGIIFEKAPYAEGEMVYKVEDFTNRELSIGGEAIEKPLFNNLLKIFEVLEKTELDVRSLRLDNLALQEIIVSWTGPKIYFSLRINPYFGLTVLESLKKLGLEKVEYIDLRAENRAYYKLK